MTDEHRAFVETLRTHFGRLVRISAVRAILDQAVADVRRKMPAADVDLDDPAQARAFFEGVAITIGTAAPYEHTIPGEVRNKLLYLEAAALELMDKAPVS